jgi:hypothetical protein
MKLQNRAFQLIFGPMQGFAHLRSPLRRRRTAVSVTSAAVVLAFALFPVLAQADSAGAQYQDRLPTATGPGGGGGNDGGNNGGDNNGSSGGQNSSSSGSGGGGSSVGGGGGGGSSPSGPSGSPGSQGGNGSGATNPGAGQGSPSGGTGTSTLYQGQNAANESSNGDDGGSSPLAGILVGLGLGAIVSVIFVVLRARRQRGQSEPVQSPNVG